MLRAQSLRAATEAHSAVAKAHHAGYGASAQPAAGSCLPTWRTSESEDDVSATATPVAAGTPLEAMQLCQGHCPIQSVAAEFPEICEAELAMFSEYLGVDVRRLSSLAHGDHVCTTHIPTSELTRPPIHANDRPQGGSR